MRKLTILLFCLLAVTSAYAKQISEQEALQKAQRFMQRKQFTQGLRLNPEHPLVRRASQNNATAYYVFNVENERGFIIVSGDDRMPEILGYSDSGALYLNNAPDNVKWWLSEYERQFEWMLNSADRNSIRHAAETGYRDSWTEVQPLLKSQWNQGFPYNNSCPTINGQPTYTGCVATAMAQIMNYYQWPVTGRGNNSYEWNGQSLSMDFSEITFDWENMQETYSYNGQDDNTEAQNAVATLMYACGISVSMDYGINESGANAYWVADALSRYFDYDAIHLYKQNTELSDWESLIYTELLNERPVYYSGRSNTAGHSFVCDGYSCDGLFHINWGWSGSCDGYFLLSILDPYNEENGYRNEQSIIYGIRPIKKVLIDGVSYRLFEEDGKASVSYPDEGFYTGDFIIPQTVTYDNKTYTVADVSMEIWTYCQNLTSLIVYPHIDEIHHLFSCSKSPELKTVKLFDITRIGGTLFKGCKSLSSLNLGESLESIGGSAFSGCSSLTELKIPNTVVSIERAAFSECTNLTTLELGDNLEYIGEYAFSGCNALKELTIPNKVDSIRAFTFAGCSNLATLELGENLKYIGDYAFSECSALTKLTIPNKVTSIGGSAFYRCSKLATLELGESLETIGSSAFYGCSALTKLTIPKKVTSIERSTFNGCQRLATLELGESLETIGVSAFLGCSALTKLTIPNKVISIEDNAFNGCQRLTTLELGESLETIGGSAFYGCSALTKLTIPNKMISIGEDAFRECRKLITLELGENLESIGRGAFVYSSISTIISQNPTPPEIEGSTFDDIIKHTATLYVPTGCKIIYKQKPYWEDFVNIIDGNDVLEKKAEADDVCQTAMEIYSQYMYYYEGEGMAYYQQVAGEQADNHAKAEEILADIAALESKVSASSLTDGIKSSYFTTLNDIKEGVSALETENDNILSDNQFYYIVQKYYDVISAYHDRLIQYQECIESATTVDELNALITEIEQDTEEVTSSYLNPVVSEFEGLEEIESRLIEIGKQLDALNVQIQSYSDEIENGNITGIANIINGEDEEVIVYTVGGIGKTMKKESLKSLPKGVYIINGKKVVVK